MRAWFNGRMEASQALDEGSIPFARFLKRIPMANEQELEENQSTLETRPAGNKDLWLFLIILDAVFLCVFGFFIYQHFAERVFSPVDSVTANAEVNDVQEPSMLAEMEALQGEEIVTQTENVETAPVVQPTAEVSVADELKNTVQEEPLPSPTVQEEQKQSILVAPSKGKYRQVTFRWFGEGKQVAVVSGFTMSKPKPLKKVGDHWEVTLGIEPGSYKFLYVIDGKNTLDPYAPQKDGRSVLEVK